MLRLPLLRIISLLILPLVLMPTFVLAANTFAVMNPDGQKYEFARSYITAVSYLKNIDTRWEKNSPKKRHPGDDKAIIRTSIEYLVKDNADLRIVKNYLLKYVASNNALIRKTADMIVVACDEQIAINEQEKDLWSDWLKEKVELRADAASERIFVKKQAAFGIQRKESSRKIIEATILMVNVLKSSSNKDEKGNQLAISSLQRKKLLEKLDSFAKKDIEWGLKPGQRVLTACVAVIREILEDPMWISIDDKS